MPETGPLFPFAFLITSFLVRAYRTGLARYYVLAAVPVVAAVLPWPLQACPWSPAVAPFVACGVASLVIGAFALRSHLLRHPASGAW